MRIIEVEYLGPPALGGVEAVVETLSRKFIAAGHEVEIWCTNLASFNGPRLGVGTVNVNGLTVRRFPTSKHLLQFRDPYHLVWKGFKQLLEEAKAGSILHIHCLPSDQAFAGMLASRQARAVVITPHHEVVSLQGYMKLWRGRQLKMMIQGLMAQLPQLNLAVHTRLERSFWRDEIGLPGEQITVVPNGVELSEFDDITEAEIKAAETRWPEAGVRLLFAGRLDRAKGVDLLLRALAQVKGITLLAIGPDAGARGELEALVKELGIATRVNFAGPLARQELCAAFRACDIFSLPSRYGENFGIVAIEAMAAGKPVIASDCGGLPLLVQNGHNGILFAREAVAELAEALARLANAPELRTSMGQAGRALVENNYTWDQVAKTYLDLFHGILAQSPAR
jgi:glycosyltransferase involved in cell wall biosynthesis